jgi:hypothetical protein
MTTAGSAVALRHDPEARYYDLEQVRTGRRTGDPSGAAGVLVALLRFRFGEGITFDVP